MEHLNIVGGVVDNDQVGPAIGIDVAGPDDGGLRGVRGDGHARREGAVAVTEVDAKADLVVSSEIGMAVAVEIAGRERCDAVRPRDRHRPEVTEYTVAPPECNGQSIRAAERDVVRLVPVDVSCGHGNGLGAGVDVARGSESAAGLRVQDAAILTSRARDWISDIGGHDVRSTITVKVGHCD